MAARYQKLPVYKYQLSPLIEMNKRASLLTIEWQRTCFKKKSDKKQDTCDKMHSNTCGLLALLSKNMWQDAFDKIHVACWPCWQDTCGKIHLTRNKIGKIHVTRNKIHLTRNRIEIFNWCGVGWWCVWLGCDGGVWWVCVEVVWGVCEGVVGWVGVGWGGGWLCVVWVWVGCSRTQEKQTPTYKRQKSMQLFLLHYVSDPSARYIRIFGYVRVALAPFTYPTAYFCLHTRSSMSVSAERGVCMSVLPTFCHYFYKRNGLLVSEMKEEFKKVSCEWAHRYEMVRLSMSVLFERGICMFVFCVCHLNIQQKK